MARRPQTGTELLAHVESELAASGQVSVDRASVVNERIASLEAELHDLKTVQRKIAAARQAS